MKIWILLLFAFGVNLPLLSATTEVDVEVDPNIVHAYVEKYVTGTSFLANFITDSLEIAIPDVTLASGDVCRVNVSFTNGKLLRVLSPASHVMVKPVLSTIETGQFGTSSSDGSIQVTIRNYHDINNLTKTETGNTFSSIWGQDEYMMYDFFYWNRSAGEIMDDSLIGGFQIEFIIPTTYEGNPVPLSNYCYNILTIESEIYGENLEDMTLLEIIPKLGDYDDDGDVNLEDIAQISQSWLTVYGTDDLYLIAENWLN